MSREICYLVKSPLLLRKDLKRVENYYIPTSNVLCAVRRDTVTEVESIRKPSGRSRKDTKSMDLKFSQNWFFTTENEEKGRLRIKGIDLLEFENDEARKIKMKKIIYPIVEKEMEGEIIFKSDY